MMSPSQNCFGRENSATATTDELCCGGTIPDFLPWTGLPPASLGVDSDMAWGSPTVAVNFNNFLLFVRCFARTTGCAER